MTTATIAPSDTDENYWTTFAPVLPTVPAKDWVALFNTAPEDTVVEFGGDLYRRGDSGSWRDLQSIDQAGGEFYAASFRELSAAEIVHYAIRVDKPLRILTLGD